MASVGCLHRVDTLRQIPAQTRFLSLEPLLSDLPNLDLTDIDWVIAGVQYCFTWNVRQFVLFDTHIHGVPFIQRQIEGPADVAEVTVSDDVTRQSVRDAINEYWKQFLERFADLLEGRRSLKLAPSDQRFIGWIEGALEEPIANTSETIEDLSNGDPAFKQKLQAWMVVQGWEPSTNVALERQNLDRAAFPAQLSTINQAVRHLSDQGNYPHVAKASFFDARAGVPWYDIPLTGDSTRSIAMGDLDAVVGNPPYIRQESISQSDKADYNNLYGAEWWGQTALSGRSDIYVHFFTHGAHLLKRGEYLGFVTSIGWMDTDYWRIRIVPQSQLWQEGIALQSNDDDQNKKTDRQYAGGKWGQYVRGPDTWFELLVPRHVRPQERQLRNNDGRAQVFHTNFTKNTPAGGQLPCYSNFGGVRLTA